MMPWTNPHLLLISVGRLLVLETSVVIDKRHVKLDGVTTMIRNIPNLLPMCISLVFNQLMHSSSLVASLLCNKLWVYKAAVLSVVLYGTKTWPFSKDPCLSMFLSPVPTRPSMDALDQTCLQQGALPEDWSAKHPWHHHSVLCSLVWPHLVPPHQSSISLTHCLQTWPHGIHWKNVICQDLQQIKRFWWSARTMNWRGEVTLIGSTPS